MQLNTQPSTQPSASLQAIGALSSLTKLHVAIVDRPYVDLNPLGQLRQLQTLALQTPWVQSQCEAVLCSNKYTLECIRLDAPSWQPQTYLCLSQLPVLDRLVIRTRYIDAQEASALSEVQVRDAHLILCAGLHPRYLQYETWGIIGIAKLGFGRFSIEGITSSLCSAWCICCLVAAFKQA